MRKIATFLITTALCLSLIAPVLAHEEGISSKAVEEVALTFVTTSLSDFVDPTDYRDDLIDENATQLVQFLKDKRDIGAFKNQLYGVDLSLSDAEVESIKSEEHNGLAKVLIDIMYNYYDGDTKCGIKVISKVYINPHKGTVLAAMTNDLSAGSLIPDTIFIQSADKLDAEYQLNTSLNTRSSSEKYNLDKIKDNLKYEFHDMTNENPQDIEKDLQNAMPPMLGRATFYSFSDNDKVLMRRYQDNWWYTFNSNYTDFTSYGGDCTNYASQVLNASNAPQYSYSSNGIYGSNYWYYRSSSNRSTSWTAAEELRTFLKNNKTKGPSGSVSSTYGALDSGDIIFLLNSSGKAYHAVVVYLKDGDPHVTAHTSAYSGKFAVRYGGIRNEKIRISGYYM